MRLLTFSFYLLVAALVHADSYSVSEFIDQFSQAHKKSLIETADGRRSEIETPIAIKFLNAELPRLTDERKILPIPKPEAGSHEIFFDLRAQFIKLLENSEKGQEIKWESESPAIKLLWIHNGDYGPSFVNLDFNETLLSHADDRIVRPSSVIAFKGHISPPLSKFSRSWMAWHEINAYSEGSLLSQLTMESTISRQNTVTLRLKSATLQREIISVVSRKFKIFSHLTDLASMRTLNALARAGLRFK